MTIGPLPPENSDAGLGRDGVDPRATISTFDATALEAGIESFCGSRDEPRGRLRCVRQQAFPKTTCTDVNRAARRAGRTQ